MRGGRAASLGGGAISSKIQKTPHPWFPCPKNEKAERSLHGVSSLLVLYLNLTSYWRTPVQRVFVFAVWPFHSLYLQVFSFRTFAKTLRTQPSIAGCKFAADSE